MTCPLFVEQSTVNWCLHSGHQLLLTGDKIEWNYGILLQIKFYRCHNVQKRLPPYRGKNSISIIITVTRKLVDIFLIVWSQSVWSEWCSTVLAIYRIAPFVKGWSSDYNVFEQKLKHSVTWKITNNRKLFITLFASAIIGLNMAHFHILFLFYFTFMVMLRKLRLA